MLYPVLPPPFPRRASSACAKKMSRTLFACAYPIGALICWLNNVLEQKLDGMKVLMFCRRPRSEHATGIGTWAGIIDLISILAVITNCLIIFLSSHAFREAGIGHDQALAIVIGLEHALFAIKYALFESIPDEPFAVIAERAKAAWRLRESELQKLSGSRAAAAAHEEDAMDDSEIDGEDMHLQKALALGGLVDTLHVKEPDLVLVAPKSTAYVAGWDAAKQKHREQRKEMLRRLRAAGHWPSRLRSCPRRTLACPRSFWRHGGCCCAALLLVLRDPYLPVHLLLPYSPPRALQALPLRLSSRAMTRASSSSFPLRSRALRKRQRPHAWTSASISNLEPTLRALWAAASSPELSRSVGFIYAFICAPPAHAKPHRPCIRTSFTFYVPRLLLSGYVSTWARWFLYCDGAAAADVSHG